MALEWYRSPDWGGAATAEFEARLARSRAYNRQQYLRIKGLSLRQVGRVDAARELFERVAQFEGPDAYDHERISAWEHLADLDIDGGDYRTAEQLYRRILALPSHSGTSGMVEISLAELLMKTKRDGEHAEALSLLNTWITREGLKFDNDLFRWHLVLIDVAKAAGDADTMRRAARTALDLVGRGPRLPRHPDVGLIHADKATIRRLRRLAGRGRPPTP